MSYSRLLSTVDSGTRFTFKSAYAREEKKSVGWEKGGKEKKKKGWGGGLPESEK